MLVLASSASSLFGSYVAPGSNLKVGELNLRYDPSLNDQKDAIMVLVQEAAQKFAEMQQSSSALAFASNEQAIRAVSKAIRDSLSPLADDNAAIMQRLADRAKSKGGTGFGYDTIGFPEVHAWSKSAMKSMFAAGTNPPWVTLEPETHSLHEDFFDPHGKINPVVLIFDESKPTNEQQQGVKAFLNFWLSGISTGRDLVLSSFVYMIARDCAKDVVTSKAKPPGWLTEGIAAIVAHNATLQVFGTATAANVDNSVLGPRIETLPEIVARVKKGPAESRWSRACFDLCEKLQENTSRAFVHLLCSRLANSSNEADLSALEVKKLYETAGGKDSSLLEALK